MKTSLCSVVVPLFLLSACAASTPAPETAGSRSGPEKASLADSTTDHPTNIEVALAAKSNSSLSGKATFTEVAGGVRVFVQVTGAPPGRIATHVHEHGDCSAADAKSAGDHFNPEGEPHALPSHKEHHLGDLGNIEVKPDGSGSVELVVRGASLRAGDPSSFLGRAIIVHEKNDDGSQPAGNAGGRIGCGVITSPVPDGPMAARQGILSSFE